MKFYMFAFLIFWQSMSFVKVAEQGTFNKDSELIYGQFQPSAPSMYPNDNDEDRALQIDIPKKQPYSSCDAVLDTSDYKLYTPSNSLLCNAPNNIINTSDFSIGGFNISYSSEDTKTNTSDETEEKDILINPPILSKTNHLNKEHNTINVEPQANPMFCNPLLEDIHTQSIGKLDVTVPGQCIYNHCSFPSTSVSCAQRNIQASNEMNLQLSDKEKGSDSDEREENMFNSKVFIHSLELRVNDTKWKHSANSINQIFEQMELYKEMDTLVLKNRLNFLFNKIKKMKGMFLNDINTGSSNLLTYYKMLNLCPVNWHVFSNDNTISGLLKSNSFFNLTFLLMNLFNTQSYRNEKRVLLNKLMSKKKVLQENIEDGMLNNYKTFNFATLCSRLMFAYNPSNSIRTLNLLSYALFVVNGESPYKNFQEGLIRHGRVLDTLKVKSSQIYCEFKYVVSFNKDKSSVRNTIKQFVEDLNSELVSINSEQSVLENAILSKCGNLKDVVLYLFYSLGTIFLKFIILQQQRRNNLIIIIDAFHEFIVMCERTMNDNSVLTEDLTEQQKLQIKENADLLYLAFYYMKLQLINSLLLRIIKYIEPALTNMTSSEELSENCNDVRDLFILDNLRTIEAHVNMYFPVVTVIIQKTNSLRSLLFIITKSVEINKTIRKLKQKCKLFKTTQQTERLLEILRLYKRIKDIYLEIFSIVDGSTEDTFSPNNS